MLYVEYNISFYTRTIDDISLEESYVMTLSIILHLFSGRYPDEADGWRITKLIIKSASILSCTEPDKYRASCWTRPEQVISNALKYSVIHMYYHVTPLS